MKCTTRRIIINYYAPVKNVLREVRHELHHEESKTVAFRVDKGGDAMEDSLEEREAGTSQK
jgi:hypothetical protein